jgi:hypothetical protein
MDAATALSAVIPTNETNIFAAALTEAGLLGERRTSGIHKTPSVQDLTKGL